MKQPIEVREIEKLIVNGGSVCEYEFRPDKREVLCSYCLSGDDHLVLYDIENRREVRRFTFDESAGTGFYTLSPNGKRLLTQEKIFNAKLYEANGKDIFISEPNEMELYDLKWLPDNKRFISVGHDVTARVWDASIIGAQPKRLGEFKVSENMVSTSVAVSSDGAFAVVGIGDGSIVAWNTNTYKEIHRIPKIYHRFWRPIGNGLQENSLGQQYRSSDGERMGSGIVKITLSTDNQRVAASTDDWRVFVFDVQTGRELAQFAEDHDPKNTDAVELRRRAIEYISLSPDGRRVLFSSRAGPVRLGDVETGKVIASFTGHTTTPGRAGSALGPIAGVSFDRNGSHALTGGNDGTIRIWKLPE